MPPSNDKLQCRLTGDDVVCLMHHLANGVRARDEVVEEAPNSGGLLEVGHLLRGEGRVGLPQPERAYSTRRQETKKRKKMNICTCFNIITSFLAFL